MTKVDNVFGQKCQFPCLNPSVFDTWGDGTLDVASENETLVLCRELIRGARQSEMSMFVWKAACAKVCI